MYRYDTHLLPPAFTSYFIPISFPRDSRSKRAYTSIYARTNTRKFSIKYQGPLIWNSLPGAIRTAGCLVQFKQQIRAHAMEYVT